MYHRAIHRSHKAWREATEASCRPIVRSVNLRRLDRISPVEPATRRTLNANLNRKIHMLDIIIGLISGAVGGNVAGAAMKENSLGTIGNSIAGIVGGGAGAGILQLWELAWREEEAPICKVSSAVSRVVEWAEPSSWPWWA